MNPNFPTPRIPDNPHVTRWVEEVTRLCQPDSIHWCDGSAAEKQTLTAEAVARGVLSPCQRTQ